MNFISEKLRKPINPHGNNIRIKEHQICKAVNLKAIPHLGQYGKLFIFLFSY